MTTQTNTRLAAAQRGHARDLAEQHAAYDALAHAIERGAPADEHASLHDAEYGATGCVMGAILIRTAAALADHVPELTPNC
jgi:hypothetical protein